MFAKNDMQGLIYNLSSDILLSNISISKKEVIMKYNQLPKNQRRALNLYVKLMRAVREGFEQAGIIVRPHPDHV